MTAAMFSVSLSSLCIARYDAGWKSRAQRRRKGRAKMREATEEEREGRGTSGLTHRRCTRVCAHAQKVVVFPCIRLVGFWVSACAAKEKGKSEDEGSC